MTKLTTMQQRVADAIKSALEYDRRGDMPLRNQVISQMYDIPGASVNYIDKALCGSGLGFAVPKSRRK